MIKVYDVYILNFINIFKRVAADGGVLVEVLLLLLLHGGRKRIRSKTKIDTGVHIISNSTAETISL